MDLYCSPLSSFSHKARMAFFEKDVAFSQVTVNLFDPDARQAWWKIYPLGKVPCLRTASGLIGESTSIIEWLDQYYQVPRLIPEKPEEARQVRHKDRLADHYVTENTIMLFLQSLKPEAMRDQDRIANGRRQLRAMFEYFDGELAGKPDDSLFVQGRQLTMADLALITGLMGAVNVQPVDEFPNLGRYIEIHSQRPSLVAARAGFDEALAALYDRMGQQPS